MTRRKKLPVAKDLTPEKLRQAAPHVAHDIRMFREAWEQHGSSSFAWTAWFIHCRSLMDFFDARGTNADDIWAQDYLTDWASIRESTTRPDGYEDRRDEVHKLAAHLTYTRVALASADEPPRPSRELTDYLLGQTALFLRHLSDERLSWFGLV